jgi:hypothetical protein
MMVPDGPRTIIQPLRQLYSLYGGPSRSNPGPSLLDSLTDGQVQPLVLLDQLWQIESQMLNTSVLASTIIGSEKFVFYFEYFLITHKSVIKSGLLRAESRFDSSICKNIKF